MNLSLYLAFLVATAILILVPGPTVMLVTATSLRHGRRAGLAAVAGSTLAAALQLGIVVTGLASIVVLAGSAFEWIRWAGVAYLVYLGIKTWNDSKSDEPNTADAAPTLTRAVTQGFAVTSTNPKTLLFLGAFLPQFVDPALPAAPQLAMLATGFLVVAALLDSAWALLAAQLATRIRTASAKRLLRRLSASILLAAGATLAAARRA